MIKFPKVSLLIILLILQCCICIEILSFVRLDQSASKENSQVQLALQKLENLTKKESERDRELIQKAQQLKYNISLLKNELIEISKYKCKLPINSTNSVIGQFQKVLEQKQKNRGDLEIKIKGLQDQIKIFDAQIGDFQQKSQKLDQSAKKLDELIQQYQYLLKKIVEI